MPSLRSLSPNLIQHDDSGNVTTTLGNADIYVLRAGATLKTGSTFSLGANTFTVYFPGLLQVGDIFFMRVSGSLVTNNSFTISAITRVSGTNDYDITASGSTSNSVVATAGDRLVLDWSNALHRVSLFKENTGALVESNPVTTGSIDGSAELWLTEPVVDLIVEKSGSVTTELWPQQFTGKSDRYTTDLFNDDIQTMVDFVGQVLGGGECWVNSGSFDQTASIAIDYEDITLRGNGDTSVISTASNIALIDVNADRFHIRDLKLTGPGNSSYNDASRAIDVTGASAGSPIEDGKVQNVFIDGFGGYGVFMDYANKIELRGSRIENIGYAGVWGYSTADITCDKLQIKDVSPGNATPNAYGITFTRRQVVSVATDPKPTRCKVDNCTIEDIPNWEAIDTHAGTAMTFSNNVIKNCLAGIVLTPSVVSAVDYYGPEDITISNNVLIEGIDGVTQSGVGIHVAGALGPTGSSGSPDMPCKNITISGNSIDSYGSSTGDASGWGGMRLIYTQGTTITGNSLRRTYGPGINLYFDNNGFTCQGNSVFDSRSNGSAEQSTGISVRSTHNLGVIHGNSVTAFQNALAAHVVERGIWLATTSFNDVQLGVNHVEAGTTDVQGFGDFNGDITHDTISVAGDINLNNVGVLRGYGYVEVNQTHSGDTLRTLLDDDTVDGDLLKTKSGIRVVAFGEKTGSTDTATVELEFGGNIIASVALGAAASTYRIEADICVTGLTTQQEVMAKVVVDDGATPTTNLTFTTVTGNDITTATALSVYGQMGGTTDPVWLRGFYYLPIGGV